MHESQGFTLGWVPAARQAAEGIFSEMLNHESGLPDLHTTPGMLRRKTRLTR